MRILKILTFSFLLLSFSFCTIQKRSYRKGYYVAWNKHTNAVNSAEQLRTKQTPAQAAGNTKLLYNENNELAIALLSDKNTEPTEIKITNNKTSLTNNALLNHNDGDCDIIIMKNGDEVLVKITEITSDEIKYHKCDNLNGPLFVIRKSEAFMIKYANGTKEVIKTETNPATNTKPNTISSNSKSDATPPKTDTLGVLALLVTIAALFMPVTQLLLAFSMLIAGFIFGIGSISKINRHPDLWKGRGWGIAAVILSLLFLLILAALLL